MNADQKKTSAHTNVKADFRTKMGDRVKGAYFIMIKGLLLQKDRRTLNVFALSNRVSKYRSKTWQARRCGQTRHPPLSP